MHNGREGGIILLSGLSGVGKSTLIHDALDDNPRQLHYLKDFTTRERRPTDNDTEYVFVSDNEFDRPKTLAADWQEGSIYENRYGHDTAKYKRLMQLGNYLIGCCYPSLEDSESLNVYYNLNKITVIHVDLPDEIRAERLISQRGEEGKRRLEKDASWIMSEGYKKRIDIRFNANGPKLKNRHEFNAIIQQIISATSDKS